MELLMRQQEGYIALVSSIIISSLLVLVAISVTTVDFFSRFNVLDMENKQYSYDLARSCVNQAILDFAQQNILVLPKEISVGNKTCIVVLLQSDTPQIGELTVDTQGKINQSYTNLRAIVDKNSFNLLSLEELSQQKN